MLRPDLERIHDVNELMKQGWTRREIPQVHPYVWDAIIKTMGPDECRVLTMRTLGGRCKAQITVGGVLLVSPKGTKSFTRYLMESGRGDTIHTRRNDRGPTVSSLRT